MVPTAAEVREVLRQQVTDPELGINIVDLGLIYDVEVVEGRIRVAMTLTTPSCPLAATLPLQVEQTLIQHFPGHTVQVDLVWEPHWTPERITPEVRKELGLS